MHILFCNYEYPPIGGGGGVVTAALAQSLAQRHDVTVLTSRAFDLPRESVEQGVRVLRAPVLFRRKRDSANLASMLSYVPSGLALGLAHVRREKVDIINTHFAVPTGPVGHILARAGRVPNVLSVHGGDVYDPSKRLSPHRHASLRAVIRRLSGRADRVVAQSQNTAENLDKYYCPGRPIDLIPLGIDEPPRVDISREEMGFSNDDVLLVTVGRVVARKGIDQLLKVVARIGDPKVKLIVIGAGPETDSLKSEAVALGVSERVHWAGYVDELVKCQYLEISDVFVSTSQHEGFGLVFLEAMAYELPIVCYDHGGQTDFLTSERNGYVVELNDLDSFIDRLSAVVTDQSKRSRMSAHNIAEVQNFFISHCARRYEELFDEVLHERTS